MWILTVIIMLFLISTCFVIAAVVLAARRNRQIERTLPQRSVDRQTLPHDEVQDCPEVEMVIEGEIPSEEKDPEEETLEVI